MQFKLHISAVALSLVLAISAATLPFYTDTAVQPIPLAHYSRFVTFLAVGTRTYACPSAANNNTFLLTAFDYDLYDHDTDPDSTHSLGKHVLMLPPDTLAGKSVFYTAQYVFTHWVGKTTFFGTDPASDSPLDLSLEQELRTEASEPKTAAGKYDMGIAVYATRFRSEGGNVPNGTVCERGETAKVVKSSCFYSMWTQIA